MGRRHHFKRAAPVHKNPHGAWCHCSFGDPRKERFVSRHNLEAVGSAPVTSIWHEAAKLEWLQGRPDVKAEPRYQKFLEKIAQLYPEHDPLYPWLLREFKNGDIESDDDTSTITFKHEAYGPRVLSSDHLEQIADWQKYNKQAKKDQDIMKFKAGDAIAQAEKNDEGGETVHEFTGDDDGNSYGHYDDWTIKRLRNKRDMRKEGDRMDHCVGSNGMGYLEKNDEGKGAYYSLRSPQNRPVATLEMLPKAGHYYMCPGCKKPAFGVVGNDLEGSRTVQGDVPTKITRCEHCQTVLANNHESLDYYVHDPVEGVKKFPVKINHKKPTNDHMQAAQLFGESDRKLDDDHESLVNSWLSKLGHPYQHSDGDSDYEDEEEEEFEPWWDEYYEMDGADTVDNFMGWHVNGEYYDDAPEEWTRAMHDADEHELDPPELSIGRPDVDAIWQDLVDNQSGSSVYAGGAAGNSRVDPHQIADMFKHMDQEGMGDEWQEQAETWLNDEYNNYLDPYGQKGGPGDFTNKNPGIPGGQGTPTMPGAHFPDAFPGDELFAKNIQFHLDKQRNPQAEHDAPNKYPGTNFTYPEKQLSEQDEPKIPRQETVPVPDQTGVDIQYPGVRTPVVDEAARDDYAETRRLDNASPIHLPYGRDVDFGDTDRRPPRGQESLDLLGNGAVTGPFPSPGMDQYRQPPSDTFRPNVPSAPGEAFGQEDNRYHQRPLPGSGGFDPMDLGNYPQGRQQGQLMPQHWYKDRQGYARQAELPPELYPPGQLLTSYLPSGNRSLGFMPNSPEPSEQTAPMWQQSQGVPTQSLINTQGELGQDGRNLDLQHPRPQGLWVAKTAGPWTDHENEEEQVGPHAGTPALNGRVVETNVSHYNEMPGFGWRRPVVYLAGHDKMYVGQPSMEHRDMMQHMGMQAWDPWELGKPREGTMPGYIDLSGEAGGGLHFFQSKSVPHEEQLHDWVEHRFGVRRPEDTQDLTSEDWISSKTAVLYGDDPRYTEAPDPNQVHLPGLKAPHPPPPAPHLPSWQNYEDDEDLDEDSAVQRFHATGNPHQWSGPSSGAGGKAFLGTDGQVHTWDESDAGNHGDDWYHSGQAGARGIDFDGSTAIYLNYDGSVRDEYGVSRGRHSKELYEKLKQAHPGVTWPALDNPDDDPDDEEREEFEDDLWESSYHPRQDDEWVAGDEQDFSVVAPEARWVA